MLLTSTLEARDDTIALLMQRERDTESEREKEREEERRRERERERQRRNLTDSRVREALDFWRECGRCLERAVSELRVAEEGTVELWSAVVAAEELRYACQKSPVNL